MKVLQTAAELFLGLCGGAATAAGVFALISVVGIIPRMAGYSHTGTHIHGYEWAVVMGGTLSNVWYLCQSIWSEEWRRAGSAIMETCRFIPPAAEAILGLLIGMFVGSLAMALAEILQVFPIMVRRTRLRAGVMYLAIALALGKTAGALVYFLNQ